MTKSEAYSNISEIIEKGFLCSGLFVDGSSIVFKTLNHKEVELASFCAKSYMDDELYAKNHILYMMSLSVFMINGHNVLVNRGEKIPQIYNFFLNLPRYHTDVIDKKLGDIQTSIYESMPYLNGFVYTESARKRWKNLFGTFPSLPQNTGISGTSELGLHYFQEYWSSINKIIDNEEEYAEQFYLTVMLASSNDPKGAKSIRSKFDSQMSEITDRRKKIALEGLIEEKTERKEEWAAPVNTREELVSELERQIRGEKDKHDKFIDQYMKEIIEMSNKRIRDEADRIEKAKNMRTEELIAGGQRILTPAETEKLKGIHPAFTEVVSGEGSVSYSDKQKFYKKMGSRIITPNQKK